MKRNIGAVAAVLFICGLLLGPVQAYAKEYRIGYVDLAKVFDEYKKTKDAEKSLEEGRKAKMDERKKFVDEMKKLKDEQALLSEKAKSEKQKVIDEKGRALQNFDMKVRDELLKERNDILGGILKDIEKVVTDYAKETGHDYILNSRMILYGSEQSDLTAEVLKRLNR